MSTVRWSDGGRFGVLPLWVLDTEISDRAKVLYARLAALAGAEGGTIRSQAEMEGWLRCKRTALRAALKELEDAGAISVIETATESGGQGRNEYVVHATPTPRADDGGSPREHEHLPTRDPDELEPGTTSPGGGVATTAVAVVGEGPPKRLLINGRDLPFDALQVVCHIQDRSPRLREIPSALNGGGKGRAVGIRELAWTEYVQQLPPGQDGSASDWEVWLSVEIPRRAAAYREKMGPTVALTPMALAKWWVDVAAQVETAGQRARRVGMATLERMEAS